VLGAPSPQSWLCLILGAGKLVDLHGKRGLGKDASAQECEARPPVHLALERLESVHLPFCLTLTPRRAHGGLNSGIVTAKALGESHQLWYPALFTVLQPGREAVERLFPQEQVKRAHEPLSTGKMRTQTCEGSDIGRLRGRKVTGSFHKQPARLMHRKIDHFWLGDLGSSRRSSRWSRCPPPIHEPSNMHIAGRKALRANRFPEHACVVLPVIPPFLQVRHIGI